MVEELQGDDIWDSPKFRWRSFVCLALGFEWRFTSLETIRLRLRH